MKTELKLTFVAFVWVSILAPNLTTLHAQNTVFTYQGRVTDNGVNFSGTGQFKFALVTSTNFNSQATAVGQPPSGGFFTLINVTFGGSGYTVAPAVTISGGGGSGATAHANISGGAVTTIHVDSPGANYSSTPTVTVAPPPPNISYTTFWSNDGTSVAGSEPSAAVSLTVSGGLFTVTLGDTTVPNMEALPAALFTQPNLQLRIWFNDGVNGSAVLNPAQNLTPAPYAIQALNAVMAVTAGSANSVSASNIAGLISASQLQAGIVSNNQTGVNLTGSFTGNGGALTNLSPNALVLVTTNESITTWGANDFAQRIIPAGLTNPIALAASRTHSLALKSDHTVIGWGAGQVYNRGDGSDYGQATPPPGLSNVTAIAAGYLHSLAVTSGGTAVAWGAGTVISPGDGADFGQAIVPTGLSNVIAVSGGLIHSLALQSNGIGRRVGSRNCL